VTNNQIKTNKLIKFLYFFLGSAVGIGVVYILWVSVFENTPFFSWSQVQAYFVFTLELLALIFLIDIRSRLLQKGNGSLFWPILLAFFVLNVVALVVFGQYYSHPERADYSSVKFLLKLLPIAWVLIGVGTTFALVRVLQNQFARAWKSIPFFEEDTPGKRARLKTIIILSLCFALGLAIRLINLDGFPTYVDEYITTHNIFRLLNGFPFEWERAFPTVGIPVLLSFKLFGINLWAARFPMVVINMIAIIPLYFLGKKINRNIGYLSVALYIINPWIIAVSRTVREYAVLPLYYFVSAVFLLDLLEWENTTIKSYLRKNAWKMLILGLILINAVYDRQSIVKIVIINFGVFGILLLLKMLKSKTPTIVKVTSLGVSFVLFILLVIVSNLPKRLFENGNIVLEAEDKYWQLLISNSFQHWFSKIPQLAWLVVAVAVFFTFRAIVNKYDEKDAVILYCFAIFLSILGFLTFFLVNPRLPARVRYGILLEYWYVILVAITLFLLLQLFKRILKEKLILRVLVFIIIGVLFINYSSIKHVITYSGGGILNVTGEKHYNVDPAYRYMLSQLHQGDVLLTDSMVTYDELHEKEFGDLTAYSFIGTILREGVTINELINKHPEGWIVLTQNSRPLNHGLVYENTTSDGMSLEYQGKWGECDIWRWKPHSN
jgi:hypothetical protein